MAATQTLDERRGIEVTAIGEIPEEETAEALLLRLLYCAANDSQVRRLLRLTSYGRELDFVVANLREMGWGLDWYTEH